MALGTHQHGAYRGKTGAKQQASQKDNFASQRLIDLIDSRGFADKDYIRTLIWRELLASPLKWAKSMFLYWFENNWRCLEKRAAQKKKASKRKNAVQREVDAMLRNWRTASLYSLLTPLGKLLGDLTGAECLALGSWFVAIGDVIEPSAIVREQLSEGQLRELLKKLDI